MDKPMLLGVRYVDDTAVTFTLKEPFLQVTMKRSEWDLMNQPTSITVTVDAH
jgi:hypothetical protein